MVTCTFMDMVSTLADTLTLIEKGTPRGPKYMYGRGQVSGLGSQSLSGFWLWAPEALEFRHSGP